MNALLNKVAIVTGASSGIGRSTAKLFAQEGAKVVVAARRQQELDELVEEIAQSGGEAIALAGDVTSETYAKALVDLALKEFGQLDIAFNNAGVIGPMSAVVDMTSKEWDSTINANLSSAFFGAKHQLPAMTSGGSLIFTSSFVGYTIGMPQMSAYAVSKAGVIGFAKALAAEYGSGGIRVNALVPSGTATPMAKSFGDSPEVTEFVNNIHALKRQATAEEIAQSAPSCKTKGLS